MTARLRSWWQKIGKPLDFVIILMLTAMVFLVIVVIMGYLFHWGWTGLNQKTLWDWLQLLIVPVALALIALLFNLATARNDKKITEQRYQDEQKIALEKQREDLLQTYLDRMSELLLKENLRSSAVDAEVRNVARARTIAILFQLDARRIGYVFAFLRESGLMSTISDSSIVSMKQANLNRVNLSRADLYRADFREAGLGEANLGGANLKEADLGGADLWRANLSGADLRRTILGGADLSGANLSQAVVAAEQLDKAKSLKGATMPDGSIYP